MWEASADAALLVLGARRLHTISGVLPGPLTRRLIAEAWCPVAVVPSVRR